jgi:hypothetical protein
LPLKRISIGYDERINPIPKEVKKFFGVGAR